MSIYESMDDAMYIGQPLRRVEDRRFLTGKGRYVDDVPAPNCAYAAFVRSPHAHARIVRIDASAAQSMPGVLCVITGDDWAAAGLGQGPLWSPVVSTDGVQRAQITRPILIRDKVRFVGDTIAAVVAETKHQAQDAMEAVVVEYEPLPSVTETARALEPGAPRVHDELENNMFFVREQGSLAEVERVFASAHHVTELALCNNRITANPMEPRAVLGMYDEHSDHYTLYSTHQAPHMLRRSLSAHTLLHPEHKIRVIAPDVGGGFGMKVVDYPEDPVVLWASKLTGRPVRWTATRQESLLTDAHGRDHATKCRMAFDKEGRILAIWADTIASLGAYQTHRGASIPAFFYGNVLVGLYRTPLIYCRVRGVHTNTSPVHAYRGAGRPEAVFVMERLLENGAREMGLDVAEVRSRNLITAAEFPYKTPVGLTYDSGDPPGLMDKTRKLSKYDDLRKEQKRLREQGICMGIGLAAWIDSVGAPSKTAAAFGRKTGGWDSAIVRVHPTGKITVFAGSHSHGQSHATTFAQLAAERLKCPLEDIEVVEGDTDRVPYGHGTWGSRSTVTSGMAIVRASDRIVEKSRKIAAFMLECAEADLVHELGGYRINGTDRRVTLADIAESAYHGARWPEGLELGLENTAFYDPVDRSFASAIHMAVVIVDPRTGRVNLRDYYAVEDCGTIINPMVLAGQVHGGVAQGVGQALMEDLSIDHHSGQVLAGTFMDYAMPRASDFPSFQLDEQVTPTPHNVIGCKGGGESGTIGAPAAVGNAVVDALWHLGVRHVEMPMTSSRVWHAVHAAKVRAA
jgi:carbon-monoxide dehydrogenase large subunit